MSRTASDGILRQLRHYLAAERAAALSDDCLLARFVAHHDDAAFAALVRRHGPLVLGVCRRVLRHEHDAEDAFQATFLVLARRAAALARGGSLANYLYTVAYRVALKARAARSRVVLAEIEVVAPDDPMACERREVYALLDAEIARLPEPVRGAVVLCDLQGKTHLEAADELGHASGSMSRLLSKGRELLRQRLQRRGVALSMPAVGASCTVPLASATPPARVVALANAVLAETWWTPAKAAASLLLTLTLVGAGLLATQPPGDEPPAKLAAEAPVVKGDPLPPAAVGRLGTARFRHACVVPAVLFLPDGKTVVSGSHLGTIRLWDRDTGKELRLLKGHPGGITSLALTRDGKRLASSSWDQSIRLWDPATGAQLRVVTETGGEVIALAFSPDGKVLAAAGKDGTVRLVLPEKGDGSWASRVHKGETRSIAFSPDGKKLASCGIDKLVRLLAAESGKTLATFEGHTDRVQSVAFSPDGKTLASCGWDKTARLWDVETGKQTRLLQHDSWLECVAFAPDGKALAIACGWGNRVHLWDLPVKTRPRWVGPMPMALHVAFSPDSKKLVGGGWEGVVRLWDVASGKEDGAAGDPGHTGWVYDAVALNDGTTLVSAGSDQTVRYWDMNTGKELRKVHDHKERVNCLALSPDGKLLASGSRDETVHLRDAATGKILRTLRVSGSVKRLAFSPDGKSLAAVSGNDAFDQWVNDVPGHGAGVWDVATGDRLLRLDGHAGGVNAVAFAPDGKHLVTAGNDRSLRVWDASGKELRRVACTQRLECVAYSPDGGLLAAGGENGVVVLLEAATGKAVHQHQLGIHTVVRVAFSRDGRTLLTTCREDKDANAPVRLWDVATGKERVRFAGHQQTAFAGTFAGGRVVVTGGGDGTLLLWDVTGGLEKGKLKPLDLSPAATAAVWNDLISTDAAKVHQAIWTLVAAPKQAIPLLTEHLRPTPAGDAKRIAQLVKELDDDKFAVREKASEDLERIGEPALDAIRQAAESTSAEVRARARRLLGTLEGTQARERRLRESRALEILEHLGTAEARQLLEKLSKGSPSALTREAKAALSRK